MPESKDLHFYMHCESALCAVQFTVQVWLGLTFHKNLEFLGKIVADLLSKKPLGAP